MTFSADSSSDKGSVVVAFWNAVESDIAEMNDADREDFMAEQDLNRVIRAGHEMLSLQTYFTAGVKEVRGPSLWVWVRLRLRRPIKSTPISR